MAVAVAYGFGLATILTLVVVPILYSLLNSIKVSKKSFFKWLKNLYWKPFDRLEGNSKE
jgi:hypothetical protein